MVSKVLVQRPWDGIRAVVVDLRDWSSEPAVDDLATIAHGLIDAFATLDGERGAAALVVRHRPAPSGRVSGSLATELVVSACRSFFRQLRYDKDWTDTPVVFVDARDAEEGELQLVITAALSGRSRIDIERATGLTAGYRWERGDLA
jgi:hypothetical protein